MASNRHLGRIVVLQTLYELDFRLPDLRQWTIPELLERNLRPYRQQIDDTDFIERLANGVAQRAQELDDAIAPIAPEWPVDQIARVDKTILRMALYELMYEKDTPAKVVINEAVELAKAFGGDSSSKFVNGVLGTAYKQLNGEDEKKPKSKTSKAKSTKKKTPTKTIKAKTKKETAA